MIEELLKDAEKRMGKAVEVLKGEFAGLRTGRASTVLVEDIKVDYYGTPVTIKQIAQIAVPEPTQITIQPWDTSVIPNIEKAIRESDLGVQPQRDGNIIRINLPPLTEERRRELVRKAGKLAEQARIAIRNVRHEVMKELDKLKKEGGFSEDDIKRAKEELQKITDKFTKKVDELLSKKEEEILTV
ncbi:ribosome recycling factor [Phorcysia thermohydrogeniphila]|jgi:ribosome recycling factor|uniref:Ribosome-recycling factor n=1 Tax=Phorcysia thermohydrogeniphila TaxID=936138 RepID=A0A4R1GCR0_9BACT|nr:ribosome recycling factor [Phorcysia thermohydrogeniphila]TCK04541.1 ribosome recycling factor [Phorcysia thermohydrogeniphila]